MDKRIASADAAIAKTWVKTNSSSSSSFVENCKWN